MIITGSLLRALGSHAFSVDIFTLKKKKREREQERCLYFPIYQSHPRTVRLYHLLLQSNHLHLLPPQTLVMAC